MRDYRLLDFVIAIFVAVLIVSNIASSAKIVAVTPYLILDGGTLLFPLAYIFGDILTEVYGYDRSRRVIWSGFFAFTLSALVFHAVGRAPGAEGWGVFVVERMAPLLSSPPSAPIVFAQSAYDAILGGVSTGAIVVASIVAYFAGEFSNAFVLAKLKVRTAGRFLWVRTISSTLVGQGVDTVLFVLIATALGVFPRSVIVALTTANYFFKVAVEVVFTPFTYGIVNALKRVENEDYFDFRTNFNPFRV